MTTRKLPETIERLLCELIGTTAASDGFLIAGAPPTMRVNQNLIPAGERLLTPDLINQEIAALLSPEENEKLKRELSYDRSLELDGYRFRVNVYHQKGSLAMCLRKLQSEILPLDTLGLDARQVQELASKRSGLLLVTGPTGSGKSTTLASIVKYLNETRGCHIITIEDPIEYLHAHGRCLISQRELGHDVPSFAQGLKDALRENPDVILVGELRDPDTIEIALRAAETGHLVMSTLHTLGAQESVLRIVNSFSPKSRDFIRVQLAAAFGGVISQTLIPTTEGKLRLVYEILEPSLPVSNMIRTGKDYMLANEMAHAQRSLTINDRLDRLCAETLITPRQAIIYSPDPKGLKVYKAFNGRR